MGDFPIFLQTMNITAAQLQGAIRHVLTAAAGYLGAKSALFREFVDPIVIDAVATLLFAAVWYWSHRSNSNPPPAPQ